MTLLVRSLDLCRRALQVPGQDDWDAQRARSYGDVDAIFMCFSVISPSSFEHIRSKARLRSLRPFPRSQALTSGLCSGSQSGGGTGRTHQWY